MTPTIGILLINLGTPDALDPASIKRYLKEFLSDPRVIEKRGLLWWTLLNGIIIPRRVKKSGRAYRLIWNEAADESPLRTITRAQAEKIGEALGDDPRIMTIWAMRYGAPSIYEGIQGLANAGCDKVLVFPLYPQYSAATTASAMDEVFSVLKEMRWQPSIRVVPPYFDEPTYIETLAEHITRHEQTLRWKPELCLASFHGLPVSFIEKGDPYQAQCETTIAHLRAKLGRESKTMPLVYQSRSRRAIWLDPDMEETLANLASDGVRNLTVVAPGFAADCIETLEEIEMRAKNVFTQAGGENFSYIPCLNDCTKSVEMLCHVIQRELSGWCCQTNSN